MLCERAKSVARMVMVALVGIPLGIAACLILLALGVTRTLAYPKHIIPETIEELEDDSGVQLKEECTWPRCMCGHFEHCITPETQDRH